MHASLTIRFVSMLVCGAALAGSALAQATHDHSAMGHAPAANHAAVAMTDGEVKKIDTKAHTITLKHGEIKNLSMPPMTMAFKVKTPKLLAQVKVGDKVRFKAEMSNDVLMLVAIETAP